MCWDIDDVVYLYIYNFAAVGEGKKKRRRMPCIIIAKEYFVEIMVSSLYVEFWSIDLE